MRLKRLENQWRCYLNPTDYATLREHANHRAAELAIRLGGECGLRVSETSEASLDDIRTSTADGVSGRFLRVLGKDTSGKLGKKYRATFLPPSLHDMIVSHVLDSDEHDAPDADILPVSKRTCQAYVKRAAENAAEETGIEDYNKVSSHDLRAFFATDLLVRKGVKPEVVMAVGGWTGYDTMKPYINAQFDDIIFDEMQRVGIA